MPWNGALGCWQFSQYFVSSNRRSPFFSLVRWLLQPADGRGLTVARGAAIGRARIERMPAVPKAHPLPRWYLVPVRILILTFLFALLAFALSLLLGIIGVVIRSRIGGAHPNLTVAYRYVALPVAAVMASVVLITGTILEIRSYRQVKALRQIEEASR